MEIYTRNTDLRIGGGARMQCTKKLDLTPQDDHYDYEGYDSTPKAIDGDAGAKLSPDGKWLAFVQNYNALVE